MACRGVRGAITVEANEAAMILEAAEDLLAAMVRANDIDVADLACILFTMTPDLDAAFPAKAARQMGWKYVPVTDAAEIPVPNSLARCIRVMMTWNTDKKQDEIAHVYLRGAKSLRPDLIR